MISGEIFNFSNLINDYPIISRDEQIRLFKDWKQNDNKDSLDALVLSNLRIVSKEAHKASFKNKHVEYEDCFQEGLAGLMKAADKFDENKGNGFLTYAMWWVKAYIKKHVMSNKSIVVIGKNQTERAIFSGLRRAEIIADENNWTGCDRIKNISNLLNVSEESLANMITRISSSDKSLDAPIKNGESDSLAISIIPDPNSLSEGLLAKNIDSESVLAAIDKAFESLSDKEGFVLRERFFSEDSPSLRQVGESISMTKEGIRIVEKRALKKVKIFLSKNYGIRNS